VWKPTKQTAGKPTEKEFQSSDTLAKRADTAIGQSRQAGRKKIFHDKKMEVKEGESTHRPRGEGKRDNGGRGKRRLCSLLATCEGGGRA